MKKRIYFLTKKENHGITLIALVVTIVVLLILAGVTINFVLGENGILNQAKNAQNVVNNAVKSDLATLAELENELNSVLNNGSITSSRDVLSEERVRAIIREENQKNKDMILDYENAVDLTPILNATGKTYTAPSSGYVRFHMLSKTSNVKNTAIAVLVYASEEDMKQNKPTDEVILQEMTGSDVNKTEHIIVNKNDIIKLYYCDEDRIESFTTVFYPLK